MTRRRIAVVSSSCPPRPGAPVTGGGLRTAQLIETLRAAKHSVTPVIEADALHGDAAPEGWRTFGDDLPAVLRALKPQIIVLEQWALASRLGDPADGGAPDVPLCIDLHGSLLLENVYRRGQLDLTLDAKTKLDALRRADLLLTPAAAQVHHFASWLTLVGFDPRELPLVQLPLAVPDVAADRPAAKALRMVYGGARWPWIDSLAALSVAADVAEASKGARLDVFVYDPPRHGLPFEEDLGTWPEVDAALSGRARKGVKLHGAAGHAEYTGFLRADATVALDLWEPNPERMLAATTRTVEFLAAGLPVVTIAGSGWAEELVASGAGWTVPAGDEDALRSLLSGLAEDPDRITAASRAALELARRRADLARSGQALLDWVQTPSRPPRAPRSLVDGIIDVRQAHLDDEIAVLKEAQKADHDARVAAHEAEVSELRSSHRDEVAALREQHQADIAALRADADARVERLTRRHEEQAATMAKEQQEAAEAWRAEMAESTRAQREEIDRLVAERREELDAARARHEAALQALEAKKDATIEALRSERDAAMEAAAEQASAARDRMDAISHKHAETMQAMREAMEQKLAERQEAIDASRQKVAERDALLKEKTEAYDTLEGRWKADRAQDKQARTKLEVEWRANLTRREEELRAETDRRIAELRGELEARGQAELDQLRATLESQLQAMSARKVVRVADTVQRALRRGDGSESASPGVADRVLGQTGRVLPAARFAKLWFEHAVDREGD